MTKLIAIVALLSALAGLCPADEFTDDSETPPFEPFVSRKAELFRFSRGAKGNRLAKYEQQQQVDNENEQLVRRQQQQAVEIDNGQREVVANELPAFGNSVKTTGGAVQVTSVQQPQAVATNSDDSSNAATKSSSSSASSSSSSSSSSKKSALSKTITTTTTTTTTHQHNQDQPQVAQIKEVHVHTVPLSQAVHYSNYVVVPTSGGSQAARLEESSSSSSSSTSHKSSSSSSDETEQGAVVVNPAPTVVVNPAPAVVAPDCVLHRLVVERPVSSQLVVSLPSEVKVSRSSSSHSSRIVSENSAALAQPQPIVHIRRTYYSAPLVAARVVAAAPVNDGHSKEEHFHSESHSSREQSGLGQVSSSSSSSSSSSRSSKSLSSTTTSQTAALLAAPAPVSVPIPVHTVTVVRQTAPLVAIKSAPLIQFSSGRTNDASVSVDHHQSGPNYNYGYSIKQHSSEPGTKGVVVGDRVVYMNK